MESLLFVEPKKVWKDLAILIVAFAIFLHLEIIHGKARFNKCHGGRIEAIKRIMLLLSVGHNEVTSVHQPRRLGEREGRVHGQQLQAASSDRKQGHPTRLNRLSSFQSLENCHRLGKDLRFKLCTYSHSCRVWWTVTDVQMILTLQQDLYLV